MKLSLKSGSKFSIKYSDIGTFVKTIWASMQENLSSGSAQTDQLLCFLLLKSIISRFAMGKTSIFYIETVPEQAGLNLTLSETQRQVFFRRGTYEPVYEISVSIALVSSKCS